MDRIVDLVALPPIDAREFLARQAAARSAADQAHLAGLLLWARGGPQQDGYADVHWLTGFYNQVPQMPDGPSWVANRHCAVVLNTTGLASVFANSLALRRVARRRRRHVLHRRTPAAT